ncbi:MAG TPA: hypothetical protein VHA12_00980 [Candidatus Nanoarchaeia archaeon]|nr:hypothetical protein [Candidatus Nanoarchaeia archaeon]
MTGLWNVHVVHPYTYKMDFDKKVNVVGPIPKFKERDEKVKGLLERTLKAGNTLIHHSHKHVHNASSALEVATVYCDPNLQALFDERTIVVTTTQYGVPLPDEILPNVSQEVWKQLKKIYDTKSSMKAKLPLARKNLFIGGIYENCLCNAVDYFKRELASPQQEVYVCPKLCVSIDKKEYSRVRDILLSRGIIELTADQALEEISIAD